MTYSAIGIHRPNPTGSVVPVDTSGQLWIVPSALDIQQRLIRAMSAEDKIRVSEALRDAAWQLKAAWIRQQHPELDERSVQDAVRQYFRDGAA